MQYFLPSSFQANIMIDSNTLSSCADRVMSGSEFLMQPHLVTHIRRVSEFTQDEIQARDGLPAMAIALLSKSLTTKSFSRPTQWLRLAGVLVQ